VCLVLRLKGGVGPVYVGSDSGLCGVALAQACACSQVEGTVEYILLAGRLWDRAFTHYGLIVGHLQAVAAHLLREPIYQNRDLLALCLQLKFKKNYFPSDCDHCVVGFVRNLLTDPCNL
jgi:hypothetical protein